MKKIVVFLAVLGLFAGLTYAQSEGTEIPGLEEEKMDLTAKEYQPADQHLSPDDRSGKIRIVYNPSLMEARIYYTCLYTLYDKGNAMNSVKACLQDLTKEYKCYDYEYIAKDRERFFRDDKKLKWAEYSSHIHLKK